MKTDFAALINPIFQHVLQLDERLRRGGVTDFKAELVKVRQVFADSEQRAPQELVDDFATARRALVYWTDEILNESDKNWGCMLEWDCFETDDRATLFYVDYKNVASRASADVLEVFYLAVVLGFKGTILDAYARIGSD
ncbi:MAG: DotU family type IV/VI secretion system protein, partial [Planctomycetaceae bacterium]